MKRIYLVLFKYDWDQSPVTSAFCFTSMRRAAAYGEKLFRIYADCESYRIESRLVNPINSNPKFFAL